MTNVKFLTIPTKKLSASITAAATSFGLNNIISWDGETDLTPADFGDEAYGIFRNADNTIIELFSFDPATIASTDITIIARGLKFDGDVATEVPAYKLPWTKGDTYVDLGTATPQVWQWLKNYIDGALVAGAPNATTTVKGIVELSTTAQVDSDAAIGETGASLVATPAVFATSKYGVRLPSAGQKDAMAGGGSFGTPSTTNKFLTQTWWNTSTKAGDFLAHSNDTTKSTSAISYTKIKEILVPSGIAIQGARIAFELRAASGVGVTSFGRIYKNGVAVGTERSTSSGTFQVYTEDFTALNLVAGDLLQIYAYNTGTTPTLEVRNMRVSYIRQLVETLTNQDP